MTLPKRGNPELKIIKNYFLPQFWGLGGRQLMIDLLQAIAQRMTPGYHFADNLITWNRNNSMLDDPAFMRAWEDNAETQTDRAIAWRRYVLCCAAYHCVQLDGDFVECGAYTGVGVKTVVDYLGGTEFPKTFWAYDLFEHRAGMANHPMPLHGPQLHPIVVAKFARYPQVRVIKGLIPEVLSEAPAKISYLHIDLNQAPAEIATLDALFDRVVPSGFVILDDYEWSMPYREQKLAEDPWFDARGYRVMPLPTGQGLVIKR
jgi:O-methyltransferase